MKTPHPHDRSWLLKFREAGHGILLACREGSSYWVHLPMALAVVALGLWTNVSDVEWCLLWLAIAMVLSAEVFNSALEQLARAITSDENPHIRDALDLASGAVLVASIGAAVVGLIIFL